MWHPTCNKLATPCIFTSSVGLVTCHGGCYWDFMWWSWIALGLEPLCLVIRDDLCDAFDLMLDLFWSHVTSPQPHVWHSHFKCHGNDCHLFKFLLQHSKTVALVQSAFEFKRGHIFVVAKIGQSNFGKSRKMQGTRISSSWIFVPSVLFSKIPKQPLLFFF